MPLTSTTTKHNSPATSHRPAPTLSGSLSPAISHSCALFCSFLHSPKTQLFSFQSFPHSLPKTPGVGYLLPLYEDQNETANCQSRRAIRSLQPPRPQGSSMPCPGSGPALWSLSAPSCRAATRASRRSFPPPDHKVPVFSNCEDFDHTRQGVKLALENQHHRPVGKSPGANPARAPGYFFFFLPNSLALSPLYSMVPSGQTMYVYSQVTIISQTKGFLVIAKNTSVSSGTSSRMWL